MYLNINKKFLSIFLLLILWGAHPIHSTLNLSGRESRFALDSGGSVNLRSSATGYTSSSFSKRQPAIITSALITYATAPLDLVEGNSYVVIKHDNILTSSLPTLFSLTNANSSSIVYQSSVLTSSLPALFSLTNANSSSIVYQSSVLTSSFPALFSLTNANSSSIVYQSSVLTSSLPTLFAFTAGAGDPNFTTSNAIVYFSSILTASLPNLFGMAQTSSSAIVHHDNILTSSLPALFALTNANSSSIVYQSSVLTSSLPNLFGMAQTSSSAIVHHDNILTSSLPNLFALTTANSSSIVYQSSVLTSSLPTLFANIGGNPNFTTSNAIVYFSNILTSSLPPLFALTTANSSAVIFVATQLAGSSATIASLQTQLGTIDHGPLSLAFTSGTVTMSYDSFLSTDHTMRFLNTALLNGNGHFINFATQGSPLLLLDPSVSVTLSNVHLQGILTSQISYGAGATLLFGNGSFCDLNNSQDLSTTLSFAGNALVNGNGKIVTMQPGGNIITCPGSTLTLKNITIRGVAGSNIRCLDNTAKIIFDNVKLVFDSNFSFTVGAFDVNEKLQLTGTSVFTYKSSQISKILARSELIVDRNMTLSYDSPSTSKTLIVLNDATSILHLNSSTLHTTMTGMQLTLGTLMIENQAKIENESTTISGAMVLGNNNAATDLTIVMLPGSKLSLETGFLDYQNTQ